MSGNSPFGVGGSGASQTNVGAGGPPWISSGNYGSDGQQNMGGNGGSDPCYNVGPGGGGGGGYFGGGGGGGSDCYASYPLGGGGGGGSSYFPNNLGCVKVPTKEMGLFLLSTFLAKCLLQMFKLIVVVILGLTALHTPKITTRLPMLQILLRVATVL